MTLQIGQPAPKFTLMNQDGNPVSLSDFHGRSVVIFAFPKSGTPGCTTQACAFRDEFPTFSGSGAVVLGVSTDTIADLKAWHEAKSLPYDLLSDTEHMMLSAYGAYGIPVMGLVRMPVANRSVFVIDAQGNIADFKIGIQPQPSVDLALKALSGSAT